MMAKVLCVAVYSFAVANEVFNPNSEPFEVEQEIANSWKQAGLVNFVESEQTDLESLKYTELKALAKEKGIKGYTNMSQLKLIEALKEV